MRCFIPELTPEWGPGSSLVLQLLILEPWITDSPPICFLLTVVLPAEKLAMGMEGSGFSRGMLLLSSIASLFILQKSGFFLPIFDCIGYICTELPRLEDLCPPTALQ